MDETASADMPAGDTEDGRGGKRTDFPVVGIGASAGGLEAFEKLFTNMPPDSGMAFVIVQHLDPTHKSILSDLVMRYTRMTVVAVEDRMTISPNWVYIIPPDRDMAILGGRLHLMAPAAPRGQRHPIDFFFRSLAQDQRERAICVVLSGTGSDGTQGLRAIKGEGGTVMVEDPTTARYDGMPRSAIATGLVDFALPAEKIPGQLLAFVRQAFTQGTRPPIAVLSQASRDMEKVLVLLRAQTGHDFSYYKNTTIVRRVERRMAVNQIERLDDYLRFLREHPLEADILFKELLIGVTNFFRDPPAFAVLKEKVIGPLIENGTRAKPIRVWVPACSTGEEAYSIAILFRECMDELQKERKVQIFATDIDPSAIETARAGIYPEGISVDVPPKSMRRFFRREGASYEIDRSIRDMLVFAVHSVIKDPPFSKIDLISCRNLLIYFKSELQKNLLPLFHYSLQSGGYFFLGSSETIGEFTDLFFEIDRRWKIFKRKGDAGRYRGFSQHMHAFLASRGHLAASPDEPALSDKRISLKDLTEDILLSNYAPACVIINEKCQILYTHGRTGPYLELPSGESNFSILKMARQGLHLELANAVRNAMARKERVRAERLRVKYGDSTRLVTITVQPVTEPPAMHGLTAVMFEDLGPAGVARTAVSTAASAEGDIGRIAELEKELQATKEYLQATIEQLETSNEELTSTNEEMQSSNEELQSTNQELQTSKEELQSMNEELATVNTELETKIDALSKANDDLNNIMSSVKMAIIFLDNHLNIKRFTPSATAILNLIDKDVGRPLEHIAHNLAYGGLMADAKRVLNDLVEVSKEICAHDGKSYLIEMRPYTTIEMSVDGIVMTFTEMTEQKNARERLQALLKVSEEAQDSILITDKNGVIEYVNPFFSEISGFSPKEAIGQKASLIRSHEAPSHIFAEMWQAIMSGQRWSGELLNKRKNGSLYLDRVTIWPIVNEEGVVSHFVALQKCLDKTPDIFAASRHEAGTTGA